ncbi:hypothetical protein Slin14017_G112200 [Septoria linicola]|nr:hypothetical protein Slin14017_G112200 [Septoria linicola]
MKEKPLAPATFLTIPREIRDLIYDQIFHHNIVHLSLPTRRRNIGLLRTCHQIHDEAIKSYYKHTTFYTDVRIASLYNWLQRLPELHHKLLTDVRRVDFEAKTRNNAGRIEQLMTCHDMMRALGICVRKEALKVVLRGPESEEVWATELPSGWPADARARLLDRRDVYEGLKEY